MGSTDIAVRLRGSSCSFGAVIAVHPIDLDIPRGDFLAILGPSGCGNRPGLGYGPHIARSDHQRHRDAAHPAQRRLDLPRAARE